MSKITVDISGRGGLVERYQGDVNDTTGQPNLRYLASDGQMASGVYNPSKKYGYLAPANDTFTTLTGTVAALVNSIQYDSEGDIVYLSEEGENVLKLDGLDDSSVSNYLSVTAGYTIKDMILSEVNGNKALVYVVDSNDSDVGINVGFSMIDTTYGINEVDNTNFLTDDGIPLDPADASVEIDALAQKISSADLASLQLDALILNLRRSLGTGSYNLRVRIVDDGLKTDAGYSDQGAWITSTAYTQNDVVTNNSVDYLCIEDHTSDAAKEPGVGGSWTSYWNVFDVPGDTTVATSDDVDASGIEVGNSSTYFDTRFSFSSTVTLSASTDYWILLEESGSSMTSSDTIEWKVSDTGSNPYRTGYKGKIYFELGGSFHWRELQNYGLSDEDSSFSFKTLLNRDDDWSSTSANGSFDAATGLNTYLYLADNRLIYWFAGKNVHTIDGSETGGSVGRVNENVLSFPPYMSVADVAETRSRMYIGLQSADSSSAPDDRYFTSRRSGVFVWDRRSQVFGGTDFYPTPGAREIKYLFVSSDGSVKAITIGSDGFTEIRAANGNQFQVIHTLDRDAYPGRRRGIQQIGGMTVWHGVNGKFYALGSVAPGEPERLYIIGKVDSVSNPGIGYISGAALVGNEESSTPRTSFLYSISVPGSAIYRVARWYPYGEGSINSVDQTADAGDVYTPVTPVPSFSNVRYINIFGIPTSTDNTDTIATVKVYFNMSTTAFKSFTVTKSMMNKGYIEIPVNKQNVNFVQLEVEWDTDELIGADTFYPMYAEIEIEDVETSGGKHS